MPTTHGTIAQSPPVEQCSMLCGGRKQGSAEFLFPCFPGGLFLEKVALWLRGMCRPVNDTCRKHMAQKLRDEDSCDGDEIFSKDEG